MRGTLTFCAIACLAVWGGLKGWDHYQSTWPPAKAARWQINKGNVKRTVQILTAAREQDVDDMYLTLMFAECMDLQGNRHAAADLYREARPILESPNAPPDLAIHRERLETLESMGK